MMGKRNGFLFPVKSNGMLQVVDDNPARMAVGQVILECLAESTLCLAVEVLIQRTEEFFALHHAAPHGWFSGATFPSPLANAGWTAAWICWLVRQPRP
jgi:hypothetical protein